MKKLTFLIILILSILSVSAQETVRLTVSGQGTTKDEATANALRSAIEQSFGVFVSANTQILNDEVVKDEIATISSGNIKEYKELGCITMPNGQQFVTLSATVSINNLISYARSKGSSAEFAGATFAMNMKIRKINKENESKALLNLIHHLESIVKNGGLFNISIEPDGQPYKIKCYNPSTQSKEDFYGMYFTLNYVSTENAKLFFNTLFYTLKSLSLSDDEFTSLKQANEDFYELLFIDNIVYQSTGITSGDYSPNIIKKFYLRNNPSEFTRDVLSVIDKSLYSSFVFQIHGLKESFLISSQELDPNNNRFYNENCIIDERDYNKVIRRKKDFFNIDDHWMELIFSPQNQPSVHDKILTYACLPHNQKLRTKESISIIWVDNLSGWEQTGKMIYQIKFDFPFTENQLGNCSGFSIKPINPADEAEKNTFQEVPQATVEALSEMKSTTEMTIQPSENKNTQPACREMHKVREKETIYSISHQYGITEEELIAANPGIKGKVLEKGKFLCIPYSTSQVNNK